MDNRDNRVNAPGATVLAAGKGWVLAVLAMLGPKGLRVAPRGSGPGLRPPLPFAARRAGRGGVGTGAVPTFDPQEAPSRRPGSNRSLDGQQAALPPRTNVARRAARRPLDGFGWGVE